MSTATKPRRHARQDLNWRAHRYLDNAFPVADTITLQEHRREAGRRRNDPPVNPYARRGTG